MGEGEGCPGEVSPVNSAAVRGPNGIWNEETLPVMEWEVVESRVVIPVDLQRSFKFESPAVLRISDKKLRRMNIDRPQDQHVLRELSHYLEAWRFHGEEVHRPGNQRILIQDESGRWYAVSIGPDRNGSHNVITLIGGSDRDYFQNRLNGMRDVVEREK